MKSALNCLNGICLVLVDWIDLHLTLPTVYLLSGDSVFVLLWILLRFDVNSLSDIISLFQPAILIRRFRCSRIDTWSGRSCRIGTEWNLSGLFLSHTCISSHQSFFLSFLSLYYFLVVLETKFKILDNFKATHFQNFTCCICALCEALIWHSVVLNIIFDLIWFLLDFSDWILYLHHILLYFIFCAAFYGTSKQ